MNYSSGNNLLQHFEKSGSKSIGAWVALIFGGFCIIANILSGEIEWPYFIMGIIAIIYGLITIMKKERIEIYENNFIFYEKQNILNISYDRIIYIKSAYENQIQRRYIRYVNENGVEQEKEFTDEVFEAKFDPIFSCIENEFTKYVFSKYNSFDDIIESPYVCNQIKDDKLIWNSRKGERIIDINSELTQFPIKLTKKNRLDFAFGKKKRGLFTVDSITYSPIWEIEGRKEKVYTETIYNYQIIENILVGKYGVKFIKNSKNDFFSETFFGK